MPKKSVNEKKEEARAREEGKKTAAKEKAAKDQEDAYWSAAGEGSSRQEKRKEDEERKRAEQAAKRAELKRLQEEEEAALTAAKSKLAPAGTQKVTKYQLDKQRELEEELKEEQLRERQMASRREVDEAGYSRLVGAHENTNRAGDGVVDARSVDHALAALSVGEATPEDKHPEKRMKAAWKAFEERTLAQLKIDKPNLKKSQYADLAYKMWQRSPENPMVQAAAAAAAAALASR